MKLIKHLFHWMMGKRDNRDCPYFVAGMELRNECMSCAYAGPVRVNPDLEQEKPRGWHARQKIEKQVKHEERCETCGEYMTWHSVMHLHSPIYYKQANLTGMNMEEQVAAWDDGLYSPQAGELIGVFVCENGCRWCYQCGEKTKRGEWCNCHDHAPPPGAP